ncbi:MAG: hypothetical protein QOD93_545, partial [Acetobacteraceae bacterium]|nr:hypothetical protein [Acetobacteraceae bacterium]
SLTAKFAFPERLKPQETMKPNERCWCGSGRKWKVCHKIREREAPINFFESVDDMSAEFARGYCSHPQRSVDACGSVIAAHTVQRRGGLESIQENRHVLTPKFTFADLVKHAGKPPPRLIGINRASTFPGFCDKHDSDLFRPVEGQDLILNRSTAFLLAFRAIAYERFAKAAAIKMSEAQRQSDRGRPFEIQVEIQEWIDALYRGQVQGLEDVENWKAKYNSCYILGDYGSFHYLGVVFDGILPVVACGAIYPEYGFDGQHLQRISHGTDEFDHITLNLTSYAKNSIALFGWLGGTDGPSAQFVQTFRELPEDQKADAVLRLCFEHLENIYIKPSWWASSVSARLRLGGRIQSGLPSIERKANCLVDDGAKLCATKVAAELAE